MHHRISITMPIPSLPAGFRFHPTDEELIVHYLMNQAASVPCPVPIIAEVNIYQCNPWDLPPKAVFGEKNEWYFFSPRDRKYPNGARPNRAAGSGYWKATGTDKAIVSSSSPAASCQRIGVKKALVFYRGKPPRGLKTDWIMHEYRLTADGNNNRSGAKRRGSSGSSSMRLDDWVLCRIYKKSNDFQFSSSDQEQEQEQEQEDGSSTVEEEEEEDTSALNNNSSTTTTMNPNPDVGDDHHQFQLPPPPLSMSMTKSCSLTDLLSTIDYSTLSQLLLDAPAETTDHEPQQTTHYTTPTAWQPINNAVNNNTTSIHMAQQGDALLCSDQGAAGYNSDLKRKRIMTTDGGATASSFDDGSSLKKKLLVQLPGDSGSSYGNQQVAEAASSSFQYHPFPFLINQQQLCATEQHAPISSLNPRSYS